MSDTTCRIPSRTLHHIVAGLVAVGVLIAAAGCGALGRHQPPEAGYTHPFPFRGCDDLIPLAARHEVLDDDYETTGDSSAGQSDGSARCHLEGRLVDSSPPPEMALSVWADRSAREPTNARQMTYLQVTDPCPEGSRNRRELAPVEGRLAHGIACSALNDEDRLRGRHYLTIEVYAINRGTLIKIRLTSADVPKGDPAGHLLEEREDSLIDAMIALATDLAARA